MCVHTASALQCLFRIRIEQRGHGGFYATLSSSSRWILGQLYGPGLCYPKGLRLQCCLVRALLIGRVAGSGRDLPAWTRLAYKYLTAKVPADRECVSMCTPIAHIPSAEGTALAYCKLSTLLSNGRLLSSQSIQFIAIVHYLEPPCTYIRCAVDTVHRRAPVLGGQKRSRRSCARARRELLKPR